MKEVKKKHGSTFLCIFGVWVAFQRKLEKLRKFDLRFAGLQLKMSLFFIIISGL
jgi:hypothetical protein